MRNDKTVTAEVMKKVTKEDITNFKDLQSIQCILYMKSELLALAIFDERIDEYKLRSIVCNLNKPVK